MPFKNLKNKAFEPYGDQVTFCEPYWYQGFPSAYYNESHVAFRKVVRDFVEKEIKPHVEGWVDSKQFYPKELHAKAYEAGIQGILYPKEFGGTQPDNFDAFHELILWDELARGGGGVLGQMGVNSMALPPILKFGSDYLKNKIARDIITGKKHICLAISEPMAGSDVANIRTTAEKKGDHYIVNGQKKWITGGLMGDYFTCLVRTGGNGDGPAGHSLLLLERTMPGIKIRKMETMFDTTHNTTFIDLEDVKVPVKNLIGQEGMAFMYIMVNFNHERFLISAGVTRECRILYQESMQEARRRMVFGEKLIKKGVIRWKLGEMARQIEALHDHLERVAYQYSSGVPDSAMGSQCALLKVQATKTLEYCAREAVQIFGGSGIVKEGRGKLVERIYRGVRSVAIPGGSEEILLDMAIRGAVRKADAAKL